ncbi:type II toxin-antitoxin system Phd/YefM family antitoxin [Desertibaculum subflavum]|uniref:type II toxin-antitoxin system Phd/YefM family antitoxin n=1 Tax=Desertibaculum subflavum TaxID=2268458 RepID=UPI0034D1D4AF
MSQLRERPTLHAGPSRTPRRGFSELLDRARSKGPQTITKHGRTAAVVVSAEEWERKSKRTGNLAEFFAGSPLRDAGIEVKRRKDRPRKASL